MILEQLYLACLSQASYFVACERSGRAVVVDPRRDIDAYLALAARLGVRIERVLLTHYHADFVSGHLELAEACGARIGLGDAVAPEYDAQLFPDGAQIELGDVRIDILHTPGHTPESVTYLVHDVLQSAQQPVAALTGDTLFVGDVGRPDLAASQGWGSRQLAALLFRSLHEKLLALDDDVLVYPAHGPGSSCGGRLAAQAMGGATSSTIGAERRGNPALQIADEMEFIEFVTAELTRAPDYFAHDAQQNRSQRPTLEASVSRVTTPLDVQEAANLQRRGTVLLDLRPAEEFAAGHLTGSLRIGLDGKFASYAAQVIPTDARVILIGDSGAAAEAAVRLGRVGLDHVVGHLRGGFAAVTEHPELMSSFARLAPRSLDAFSAEHRPPLIVDVRSRDEFEAGALPDALNIPLPELTGRLGELPTNRDLVAVCRSGYRSVIAAGILLRAGLRCIGDLDGGMLAHEALHASVHSS